MSNESTNPINPTFPNTWEEILNGYLEGSLLRADAESLRWKIQLSQSVRDEIGRDLKLSDDLSALAESIAPRVFAAGQLVGVLRDEKPVEPPAHWQWTEAGPIASGSSAAVLEHDDGFEEYEDIAAELVALGKTIPVPEGAVDRLVTRLRREESFEESTEAGEGPIVLFPPDALFAPDALAASKDDEPADDDTSPADGADRR